MDIADLADDVVEQIIQTARAAISRIQAPKPTGFCLNCEESVPTGLFCDADCRDQHAHRESAMRRAGIA